MSKVKEVTFSPGVDSTLIASCKNIDFNVDRERRVFWSGPPNRVRALEYCNSHGSEIHLLLDRFLAEQSPGLVDKLDAYTEIAPSEARELWTYLSQRFAQTASGNVVAFAFGHDLPDHILEKVHEKLHLPAVPMGMLEVISLSQFSLEVLRLLQTEGERSHPGA